MALLHLVLAEDLVLLYAKSGTGKTSLLNAGVLKPLRDRDYFPIMLRLTGTAVRAADAVLKQIDDAARLDNVEVETLGATSPGLAACLNARRFWRDDVLLAPILVFDQFEELFTVTPPRQRQEFIEDFATLARTERFGHETSLGPAAVIGGPRPKIILSMREDYLGELEEVAAVVPLVMTHRFRLTALTREQAEEAIVSPAASGDARVPGSPFTFEREAVNEMLDFLCAQPKNIRGGTRTEVEPFQLQILCQHIEMQVQQNGVTSGSTGVVRTADLGGCEGMEAILHGFYVNRIGEFDESDRDAIRRLCETGLISDTGKRLSLEEEQIQRQFSVGKELLYRLIQQRLLRADPRTGSTYYELSHDTLVGPILKERDEQDPEVLVLKAETNRIGGNYREAMRLFERAVALEPSHVVANVQWANMLMEQLGRVEDAERVLSTARDRGLDHESAYHALGRLFAVKGNQKSAIEQYRKALTKNDTLPVVYADLAIAYRADGQLDQAAKAYARSIELDPENAETHRSLTLLAIEMHQFDRAIETFRDAASVNPKFGHIGLDLAKELIANNQQDRARAVCEIALKLDSEDHAFYQALGNQLVALGEFAASFEAFNRSARLAPSDPWTYFAWSLALSTAGHAEESRQKIMKALQLDPVNVLSMGAATLINGDSALAVTLYEHARELLDRAIQGTLDATTGPDSGSFESISELVSALLKIGDNARALRIQTLLVQAHRRNFGDCNLITVSASVELAIIFREMENFGDARVVHEQILECTARTPTLPDTLRTRVLVEFAKTLEGNQDFERAANLLTDALDLSVNRAGKFDASSVAIIVRIARIEVARLNVDRAGELFDKAIGLSRETSSADSQDQETLDNLQMALIGMGGVCDAKNDFPAALEHYREAHQVGERLLMMDAASTARTERLFAVKLRIGDINDKLAEVERAAIDAARTREEAQAQRRAWEWRY